MSQPLFKFEHEMQAWLSAEIKKHESINDFIVNLDEFRAIESSKLDERKVLESFKNCLESLNVLDLIAETKTSPLPHQIP